MRLVTSTPNRSAAPDVFCRFDVGRSREIGLFGGCRIPESHKEVSMLPRWFGRPFPVLALLAAGCRTAGPTSQLSFERPTSPAAHSVAAASPTIQASFADSSTEAASIHSGPPRDGAGDDSVANARELSLETLIADVEATNPSLQSMVAAWQAASQRYPQVVSLDDPMLQTMLAPASLGSSTVEPAYAVQLSQKIPWYGKRATRGEAARAEANAAGFDVEDNRVRLHEATRLAFFDYYLVQRDLELNDENIRVMREFRQTAQNKYQANQVTQQDVLQADVELADLDRRRLELERMHRVSIARINTLLRHPPNAFLPPSPHRLATIDGVPQAEVLQQIALERRPDLAAIRSRVESEQAAVALACKEYYPDVEIVGRYDTFWQPESTMGDLRGQIGVNINLPIYRGRLNAAVNEATFRLSQRRAEYEQRVLDIQYEVQSAYEQLDESRKAVHLYADRIIPAAEQNVAAARTNYDVAKMTFLALAQSERQLIELREKQQDAIANYHRRLAELQRVIAGSLSEANSPFPTDSRPPAPR
jgi:cobalt-zinc-cadmium efflux system outer membrane protein